MLWDKLTEENYVIYVNRDIDLKIKVFELMENDEIYFFLVDNHMDSVLNEKYRANW